MALALNAGLSQYRLVTAERELLEKTLSGSVKLLTDILSMIDPQALATAVAARFDADVCQIVEGTVELEFEMAAMLCQIGL